MKIYVVVDRSGSMSSIWNEAIAAVNTYVTGLKPKNEIYVAFFDNQSYDVARDTTVSDCKPVENSEFSPRGMTPLYDAVGKTIEKMEEDNKKKAVLVIMTDGYENNSKEYTAAAIKAKLAELEAKSWPVVFIGANFKEVDEATASMGVSKSRTSVSSGVNLCGASEDVVIRIEAYSRTKDTNEFNYTAEERLKHA